ncbi:MAG: hypothetical protein HYW22_02105 [Candidatus Aenigmarchaeota archaeon]|nr:hypothetical protein [Candidatus Aenigmarchaeota archaeon]
MTYNIAVTSGLWSIARGRDLAGIKAKISQVLTQGVNSIQVDLDSVSELTEPGIEDTIRRFVDDLQVKWVMHTEIIEETALETAMQTTWRHSQRRLHMYLDTLYEKFVKKGLKKLLPEYINFHISIMMSMGYFGERYRIAGMPMLTFGGEYDWSAKFLDIPANEDLKDWFRKDMVMIVIGREAPIAITPTELRIRTRGNVAARNFQNMQRENPSELGRRVQEFQNRNNNRQPDLDNPNDLIQIMGEPNEKDVGDELIKQWLEYSRMRFNRGAITDEEVAYAVITKYLELKRNDPKEPLWKLFFGDKTIDEMEGKIGEKKKWEKPLINIDTNEIYLHPDVIAMVACRYILGHFDSDPGEFYLDESYKTNPDRDKDPFFKKKAIEKLKEMGPNLVLVFENPEAAPGSEGLRRVFHAKHMYNFVKAAQDVLKTNQIRLLIDFNHWLNQGIDPEREVDQVSKEAPDFGKYVFATHIYNPVGVHEHMPFEIPSDEQFRMYGWLYKLRQVGFKDGFLTFERGGGQNMLEIARSVIPALREIRTHLEKDIAPDKLPMEFFGISPEGILSPQRQMVIIREHARDPLRGLILSPEEEHTALGKEALSKPGMTPEKWKKEELR